MKKFVWFFFLNISGLAAYEYCNTSLAHNNIENNKTKNDDLKDLKDLKIFRFNFDKHTLEDLIFVLKNCKKLVELSLESNKNLITDKVLVFIAPYLKNIKKLSINKAKITDKVLNHIAKSFENIIILEINSCPQITDEGIGAIIPHLKNLKVLNLSLNKNITDQSISLIAEHLHNLVALNLASNQNVSEDTILLLKKLPYLTNIILPFDHWEDSRVGKILISNDINVNDIDKFHEDVNYLMHEIQAE